jgi:hypothetical protein
MKIGTQPLCGSFYLFTPPDLPGAMPEPLEPFPDHRRPSVPATHALPGVVNGQRHSRAKNGISRSITSFDTSKIPGSHNILFLLRSPGDCGKHRALRKKGLPANDFYRFSQGRRCRSGNPPVRLRPGYASELLPESLFISPEHVPYVCKIRQGCTLKVYPHLLSMPGFEFDKAF